MKGGLKAEGGWSEMLREDEMLLVTSCCILMCVWLLGAAIVDWLASINWYSWCYMSDRGVSSSFIEELLGC
jgi:hypothetical protein